MFFDYDIEPLDWEEQLAFLVVFPNPWCKELVADPSLNRNSKTWYCSLHPGHSGEHVACRFHEGSEINYVVLAHEPKLRKV